MPCKVELPRRLVVMLLAGAASLGLAPAAQAQPTLTVAGYGGSYQQAMTGKLIPVFERECRCRVNYVPGLTSATIARLMAEKDRPTLDVAIVDDGPQNRAVQAGLLAPLDPARVTNLSQMHRLALMPDNIGARLGVSAIGISYNTKVFAERGWAPPTSFADLGRPELKGKVAFPSISNALGVAWLVMSARANGGGESNIDPGFAAIIPVRNNALLYEKTADLTPHYQQGAIFMGLMTNFRTNVLASQGFPVAFVYPREGAPASVPTVNVVKGSRNPELAQAFANFMLSRATQEIMARDVFFGPLNTTVQLTDDEKKMIVAPEDLDKLTLLDWPVVNDNIAAWTERWNREVETR